jgi:tape measure domain-containing protein
VAVAVVDVRVDSSAAVRNLQQVATSSKQAESATQQLTQSVNGATVALTKSGKELHTAANGMQYFIDAAGRARKVNGQFVTSAEAAAAGLQRQASAARNAGSASNSAQSGITAITGALGPLIAALGIMQAAQFVFVKTAEIETQTRSIQTLTGSAQQAKQIISELQQLGAVTPFTSTELIDAAKRLQAFGVEAKNVVETTRRLADVSGATGAELQGLVTAYGQVQAKGRLQGEELLQFQERGIALQGELRKMYGLSGDEFQKALSKGQISAQAVEVAIVRLTEKGGKYANGAIAQSDTLAGKFSTLQDGIDQVARAIGTSLTPALKGALDVAIDLVTRMGQAFAASSITDKEKQAMLARAQSSISRDYGPLPGGVFGVGEVQMKFGGRIYKGQPAEVAAQMTNAMINAEVARRAQAGLTPTQQRPVNTTPPPMLAPAAPSGGGGGGQSAANTAAKTAETTARQIAESSLQLKLAQAQYELEGRILSARQDGYQPLVLAREAQAKLLQITYEANKVAMDKTLPAAQKENELAVLKIQAAAVARQLAVDVLTYEQERVKAAAGAMQQLEDELGLQNAKLYGLGEEYALSLQIRDLKAQYPALNEADIRTTLQKTQALKQQASAAEELKSLYADIGMSIKSGVVDAIQGAIDGTKSLQQVAVDLLNNIANKLLDVAVNMALFGAMSGTGTGGGLLGGLFKRAQGGSVTAGQPYLVGERGPELFMPGRSGGIAPTGSFGGTGVNVTVNVTTGGSSVQGDQTQGRQLGIAVAAAVQSELIKQKRPGGLLA